MNDTLSKAKLILTCTTSLRFFGYLFYKFDLNISNSIETATVSVIKNKPTITLSEKFIELNTPEQLVFVIIHEIMHYISGHLKRSINKDHKIFNIAADHCINDKLIQDYNNKIFGNYVKLPNDYIHLEEFKFENSTVEEIYDKLLTMSIPENKMEDIVENSQDVDDIQAEIRSIIEGDIIRLQNSDKSSKLIEYIKQLINVELPWNFILDQCIKNTMTQNNDKTTWKSINKIYKAIGYTLPGQDFELNYNELYIVIDTSGSISKEDLECFYSTIDQSLMFFEKIVVFQHDTEINSIKEFDKYELNINELKIIGRGGTSHRDVFDEIDKRVQNGNDIDLILVLSDLYSDINEYFLEKYPWIKEIPIKYICNTNHNTSVPQFVKKNIIKIKRSK